MLNNIFGSIFQSSSESTVSVWKFLLCIAVSLVLGIAYGAAYSHKAKSTSSFRMAISLLPAVVCVIIMMVNGNVGVGVAVAGAFSLVRFRSAQGSAREICAIFMAMCTGLIMGVGYIAFAALFTLVMAAALIVCNTAICRKRAESTERTLKMTVPENLDYSGAFDDIFDTFCAARRMTAVKTTGMGSLFRLTYDVTLKRDISEKEFIDALRTRNGNLEISLLRQEENENEL